MAIQKPERVRNMLAYSSIILKASQEYTGNHGLNMMWHSAGRQCRNLTQIGHKLMRPSGQHRDHPVGSCSEKQGGVEAHHTPHTVLESALSGTPRIGVSDWLQSELSLHTIFWQHGFSSKES